LSFLNDLSPPVGWTVRFGHPQWKPDTSFELMPTNDSEIDKTDKFCGYVYNGSLKSSDQLMTFDNCRQRHNRLMIGQILYDVTVLGKTNHIVADIKLQKERLFHFDDKYKGSV
jgi:hypothetical protein